MNILRWDRSTIIWTPDGYELRVPVLLTERASGRFAASIEHALDRAFGDFEYEASWSPGTREDTSLGDGEVPNTDQGELRVASAHLFGVPPRRLYTELESVASQARDAASHEHEREESIAANWLGDLRILGT